MRAAARRLRPRPLAARTSVIVLLGGADYFSNGIHLNVIEAAEDPAAESWRNLVAINDLVRDIVQTDSHLVVSALAGDAAAGGVPLALAADYVVAREDVVLNPYYQHMGGLYGSEYWTYLLPRRVGRDRRPADQRAVHPARAHHAAGSDSWTPCSAPPRRFRAPQRRLAERLPKTGFITRLEQTPPARARRARQAARGLPQARTGPLARMLLRPRPQLSRGAASVRLQTPPADADTPRLQIAARDPRQPSAKAA